MNYKRFLFAILIIALIGLPQIASAAINRISGNGYIFPETTTYKATFSMDVSKDGENPPSGWVKYYYSRTRMNMVSTGITDFITSGIGTTANLSGTCTINNIAGYTFTITAIDKVPDSFQIKIFKPDGSLRYSAGPKNLSGGNLVVTDTIPPTVIITSPLNLVTVGSSPINISGIVDDPAATVTVNGIPAAISSGQFTVSNVTISEGMNTIVARAIDPSNNIATASVNISLDSTPPHIAITSPPDGYKTASSPITVTGIINDIVRGTVNDNQGSVIVNGIDASISNRNFIVESVPLSPGLNTITAVGADQWGNTASTSITVNLDTTPRSIINIVSGNNQSGAIGSTLPEPFVVSVVDETGTPVVGATTIFRITENNGMLTGSTPGRAVAVSTDVDGLARATLTLGTWAGFGNNKVDVTSTGVDGNVIFTVSGLQKTPAAIYVAQGNQQRGAVNQPLPEPLVAYVTDEGHNPLGNVPVIFKAVEGDGLFDNGMDTVTVSTDSDGRATVAFTLGPAAGNDSNAVNATFEGNSGLTACYTATGMIPGDPGNTKISGVVLDNSNNPIPNVTMRVEGTTREALTDATGQFVIENVPVGPVHLIADGSTAGKRGEIEYPNLMYEITTISGANNTVSMPIYLLPLDLANAKWVGGSEDVTYTIPDVPGFEIMIKANSVTFPDSSKEGYISVTQVHADKVPMVPQIGQQPRFIITIQPPGAVFDPPAPITLPNVDGLAPGEKTNMYSFDHDLGIFVSIGTGTVSEDGMLVKSDPGVGVVKAGWHCGGNPTPTGSVNRCPECAPFSMVTQVCSSLPIGARCHDDGNACTEDKCGACTPGNCRGGGCTHPAKPDGSVIPGEECKECLSGNASNKPDCGCCNGGQGLCKGGSCQNIAGSQCGVNNQIIPAVVNLGVPADCNDGVRYGTTSIDKPPVRPVVNPCIGGDCSAWNWNFRVDPYTSNVHGGPCSNKIDISGFNDPGVTEATYCAIINDLTPDARGIAPRNTYWSEVLTLQHENFHITEWETVFRYRWSIFEAVIERLTVPISCTVDDPAKALAQQQASIDIMFDMAFQDAFNDWHALGEDPAYADGKLGYQTLVDSICLYARYVKGWTTTNPCAECASLCPNNCDDGNVCTDDTCDLLTGCRYTNNNNLCDDGNVCTSLDVCSNGVCTSGAPIPCDDGNICTDDACDSVNGCTNTNNIAPCDDGNACTLVDICSDGVCTSGAPNSCNDGNVCTDDSCDPLNGCTNTNNIAACDDGNICTLLDVCSGGVCTSGAPISCNDGNVCTDDTCDSVNGCTFTNNNNPCEDGDACTLGDICSDGVCTSGAPNFCNDGNVCTDDTCDSVNGCTFTNNNNPCEDGNACTLIDVCSDGVCTSGIPISCDDGNICTDDACDFVNGCTNTNNNNLCDDGNVCTTMDVCSGGICTSGSPDFCDDGNICTDDACDSINGCTNTNNNNACDDGNPATFNDTCISGVCTGSLISSIRLRIDEIVTDPQSDWSDNSGVQFDSTPGNGVIDTGDEYIEIRNLSNFSVSVRDMVLRMSDSSPEDYVIGSGGGTIEAYTTGSDADMLLPGHILVIGNPSGDMDNDIVIQVLFNYVLPTVLGETELGGGGAPSGNSTGPNDEAILRVYDTGNDSNDFIHGFGDPGVETGPP